MEGRNEKGDVMDKVLVIGIAGGSGSGKTTLSNRVVDALDFDVTTITHDNYYRAHHDMAYEERTLLNYDHPDSYETDLLAKHLEQLRQGKAVECPVYDFSIHDRTEKTILIEPTPIIIVEGILILSDPKLRELMDIKVFVDAAADVRILRRLQRDVRERGRTIENVISQYLTTVKPMHEAFVEPSKRYADIIVPTDGEGSANMAIDLLVSRIQAHLS